MQSCRAPRSTHRPCVHPCALPLGGLSATPLFRRRQLSDKLFSSSTCSGLGDDAALRAETSAATASPLTTQAKGFEFEKPRRRKGSTTATAGPNHARSASGGRAIFTWFPGSERTLSGTDQIILVGYCRDRHGQNNIGRTNASYGQARLV